MTQPTSPTGQDSVIRISKSDAESQHVNDLLKRQMSLRGETGITRDLGRRWYYQNWFVLAIAGLISALIGWAVLRPITVDRVYIQGAITQIGEGPAFARVVGAIKLGARKQDGEADPELLIVSGTRQQTDGQWGKINMESLHVGDRVGAYVDRAEHRDRTSPLVITHIVKDPKGQASDDLDKAFTTQNIGFFLFFPVIAGLVGLGIGAADGIMCRLPRRVLLAGSIGCIVALIGGVVTLVLAGLVYAPISQAAEKHATSGGIGGLTTTGFLLQLVGRSLAWAIAGTAMGLGQGLATRSGRVVVYGLLGGVIGGLFGGLLFDPIALLFHSADDPNVHLSRGISIGVVGMCVGAMIGVVELLARDAWLRMAAGPLAGKEFLIFKNIMNVGASPKSDIYLFNDPAVAAHHAVIRATGDTYEIEAQSGTHNVTINGRSVQRGRLRHGDQIGLGRTIFVFQRKSG